MADRAKHAHGSRKNLENAIAQGIVNEYDVLFLSGEGESNAIGWVSKDGEAIIIDPVAEVSKLETELETELAKKVSAEEVDTKLAAKADAEKVKTLEAEITTKADAEEVKTAISAKADTTEVDTKIGQAVTDTVKTANAYTDKMVEAAMGEHLTKKYEITDVPEGTLVDYRESEIRVMCPESVVFTKQNVGTGGDANSYYMTFKTYFPENAVGYIEHLNGQADEEILTKFSTDEYARKYQPTWLALAKYDESTSEWTYYGKSSSADRYIGYDYQIDWYDADGVMIASDSVRINLSNEDCHSSIEPYYVGKMKKDIETMVEEKIAEADSAYEIIEF